MITCIKGSAPRTVGTRMVVTRNSIFGTVGGGALEFEGISHARALIARSATGALTKGLVTTREFNLGNELAQCYGGKGALQFDCHFANDFVLHVFGAGHVGLEVARLALRLPCVATTHDTRKEWLTRVDTLVTSVNDQPVILTTQLMGANTYAHIEALDCAAYYLMMTHSHELDMEIVEVVLSRSDAIYYGLRASDRKAEKFRHRLKRKEFHDAEIQQLSAPLGRNISTGNSPMEVAIAGMSDVLTTRECVKNSKLAR